MLFMKPQGIRIVLPECLLVADDVRMPDRGDDSNLIQRVLLFLVVESYELYPLKGVLLVVGEAADFVHRAVGAFPLLTDPACR